jgi:integrase
MSKIPGIFERPPNSGIWWISYYDADGKRHREKAGRRPAAIDAVSRRRREIKDGRYIPPHKGARLTFAELAHAAMAQKKIRLAPSSYEMDTMRLKKLLPLIGNVPAQALNAMRLEETLAHLKQSVSNSTVNRYRALISSIYSFGIRSERIGFNPVARVKAYPENDSRLRWLRPEEERRIRRELVADSNEWELDLALNTGMRRGEQFTLRWKDVDLDRGILTVKGKTGRRHVLANEGAVGALRKLQNLSGEREFVCPDNDGKSKRDWRHWFEDAVGKAKVTDFRWHDLRHTFASRLVMAGVDIRTVQELLGHRSIVQTMKYSHLAADHRKAAVAKMKVDAAVPRRRR